MNTQTSEPVIVPVPSDETLATEPAKWIGKMTSLKNAAWLIAAATGTAITPELDGAVDAVIKYGILAIFGLITIYNAIRQGLQTREAVYSPAAAAAIAEAPHVKVVPGDPRHASPTPKKLGRPRATGRA